MNNPTSIITADPRVRRTRRRVQFGTPPAALVLVAATYDGDTTTLRLTFGRAIDIDALVGSTIVVDDGGNLGLMFNATGGAVLETPTRVALTLIQIGDATGEQTMLTAAAGNGIMAVDDGGAWAGVGSVELPFP
jgi:hypothetical protein